MLCQNHACLLTFAISSFCFAYTFALHDVRLAGISAADEVPQQVPHASNVAGIGPAAAQPLDSDKVPDSEASDSERAQEGGESSEDESDADQADALLEDSDGTDVGQSSLEERRAGMPAESSGQPAVTPGALLLIAFPVQELLAHVLQQCEALLLFAILTTGATSSQACFCHLCLLEQSLPVSHILRISLGYQVKYQTAANQ